MHRLVINALRCGARSSAQILPFVAALGFLTFSTAPKIGFQTLLQSLVAEEHAPQVTDARARGYYCSQLVGSAALHLQCWLLNVGCAIGNYSSVGFDSL